MNINEFINGISSGTFDSQLRLLYGSSVREILRNRARYLDAAEHFSRLCPECGEISVFSVPGSILLGGTNVCSLSAYVSEDIIAIASPNDDNIIRIASGDLPAVEITVGETTAPEAGTGIVGRIMEIISGNSTVKNGFSAYISYDNSLGDDFFYPSACLTLFKAITGRFCEDSSSETVKSLPGGFVFSDRNDSGVPYTETIFLDLESSGYALCIANFGFTCTSEEINVPTEIADEEEFFGTLPDLRKKLSDGELLKVIGVLSENKRVRLLSETLRIGDTEEFFALVNNSPQKTEGCAAELAALVGRHYLNGSGAVWGSGNLVSAFVPKYTAEGYTTEMNRIFGENCCHMLFVRSVGASELTI